MANKVLALVRQARSEVDLGIADLLILLKGNVSADHVVEENAKGPNGGRVAVIPAVSDPFWWGINSSS